MTDRVDHGWRGQGNLCGPQKEGMKARLGTPPDMKLTLGLLLLAVGPAGWAAPAEFASSTARTHLVELFSSEGCSSCPPAERWLGNLRTAPGLWRDFVPVAFHVNYWDRLGWPDRFAREDFTRREYAYAAAWASESVYTPCFVLDGREWRAGSGRQPPRAGAAQPGVLRATYAGDGTLRIEFAGGDTGDLVVEAAMLGGGIVSPVRAGENEGRTLTHDFVVLGTGRAALHAGRAELTLPIPAVDGVPHHGLAVWVTRPDGLAPIQATGGWLD